MNLTISRDLLCCENGSVDKCIAIKDPVLLGDDRVLDVLLNVEDKYMPNCSYFSCVQKDIDPTMREILSHWMIDVCHKERQQEEVFTLAMNLVDRFLSIVPMRKQQLQLLGTVCLLLASKLKEFPPMDATTLVSYADGAFRIEDLRAWEVVVLSRLKWDISAITPHAFLDQILSRLQLDVSDSKLQIIRKHALFFIKACATDSRFSAQPPSLVASAAVASAIQSILPAEESQIPHIDPNLHPAYLSTPMYDINSNNTGAYAYKYEQRQEIMPFMQDVYNRLHSITQIDTDCLREFHREIEVWTEANALNTSGCSATPTDVSDIVF